MARLETLIIRGDTPTTWPQRVVSRLSELRSYWLGPWSLKDKALKGLIGEGPVSSGVNVSEATALGVSAFFCAATTIAWDTASLPLFLFHTRTDGGKERFTAHPLNRLLHDQPNPESTSFQLRAALLLNAVVCGNGYAEVEREGSGRPRALWHVAPDRVSLMRDGAGVFYRITNPNRADVVLPASDVIHLRGPSPDGALGYDLVSVAKETLGLALATEKFGATFFGNGATMGGIVSYPGPKPNELTDKGYREQLQSRHQGVDRAHRLLLLYGGAKFERMNVAPDNAQFIESRVHQIREVARYFRIPVSMLGDLERSTYANHEQEVLKYYTSCLRPWLVNLEQELSSKLIAPSERNIQHIEHVTEGFLRADSSMRAAFYATMVQNGLMTPNEIRERENLAPIPGGDVAYKPMNTEPLTASSNRRQHYLEEVR